ncbi:hypothetical protein ACHAXA_008041 [Cyclostephanos tholiformis]|uniref:O-fucosyltransferase family protein n=1 Tax=Cyclostephanos tholiformis TaxID=382380 RepID=A0ABD3RFC3_9STRA
MAGVKNGIAGGGVGGVGAGTINPDDIPPPRRTDDDSIAGHIPGDCASVSTADLLNMLERNFVANNSHDHPGTESSIIWKVHRDGRVHRANGVYRGVDDDDGDGRGAPSLTRFLSGDSPSGYSRRSGAASRPSWGKTDPRRPRVDVPRHRGGRRASSSSSSSFQSVPIARSFLLFLVAFIALQIINTHPKLDDSHSIATKSGVTAKPIDKFTDYSVLNAAATPLRVCDRKAPIPHEYDMEMTRKYDGGCQLRNPPEQTSILLLEGWMRFGRTGNNLIEIMHGLQYAKDMGYVLAMRRPSWSIQVITSMWMAPREDDDLGSWRQFVEQSLCVIIVDADNDLHRYRHVRVMNGFNDTKELYMYQTSMPMVDMAEYVGHIIRTLFRSYNDGGGSIMEQLPVSNMCSVIDAIFGSEKGSSKYSVIHGRSFEGHRGLGGIASRSGCDRYAALNMEPDYIKAILEPLGMLEEPILLITDNQRPEILERLLNDTDIGPSIHLIPPDASWIGGDITAAVMADVFIGNPASSFSGFIAKSRLALGYEATFLFRKKDENGEWIDSCSNMCIFDRRIMRSLA